MSHFVEWTS